MTIEITAIEVEHEGDLDRVTDDLIAKGGSVVRVVSFDYDTERAVLEVSFDGMTADEVRAKFDHRELMFISRIG